MSPDLRILLRAAVRVLRLYCNGDLADRIERELDRVDAGNTAA